MILRGEVVVETVEGRALQGNRAGDPTARRIPVYVPPSYGTSTKRYPVIYMLNGFSQSGLSFLNSQWRTLNLPERVDDSIVRGATAEVIVVMADGMTYYGGSHYIDSPATGNYQTFIAEDIVDFIDKKYRTIPARESRGLVGKSMGGYGSLLGGMQRGDVFSAIACHSGDTYVEHCFGGLIRDALNTIHHFGSLQAWMAHFEEHVHGEYAKLHGAVEFNTAAVVAMSSCWSPHETGDGFGFWLPFDPASGAMRDEVIAQWRACDPVSLVDHYVDALQRLSLLYIDCGSADEYHLHIGARMLVEKLKALGIPHTYDEFSEGHRDTGYRYGISLPLVSAVLARS